ncbi:NAD(P)/FAD-dependent oxidoreductase [Sphingomonas sp.]|uniref:flavin monoamine oxidase family protein n=1 Tax=Sphingomonas sp. TaxID=28214 RepID=UPI001EB5FA9A|nr:NAD(P)/FAD-dependent oxidoreductase [Sphingomonas sp.]MBX3595366.1 FAD-dependent oxidoreductase [Sphingomonas sp.]
MRGGDFLWRALEAARRRNLAESGEAQPHAASPVATRRALLRGFAATGVAVTMPAAAPARPPAGPVAIIGGGIAGLTALHYLREAGVDARLYEGQRRLGGRIHTVRASDGTMFEMGAQLVNTDHDDMHALTRALGVALVDRKRDAHRTLVLADGRVIADRELADALRPIAAQIGADADRIDRDRAALIELDSISIAQYLDRHAALLPAPWVRRLMETTGRTEYGAEPDATSALSLVFNLPTVDGARADILGGSDERYLIEGGSGALIAAMVARHAGAIHRGRQLRRVERAPGGVRLGFTDGGVVGAATVIVAVPAPVTRRIDFATPLPPAWRGFIAAMDLGRNEKVLAAAAQPRWRERIGAGGEIWQTGGSCASGWDGSVAGAAGDPVWTWYLGGDEVDDPASPGELARRYSDETDGALGDMASAWDGRGVRRTRWHRDPFIQGAYGSYPPGHLTRFGRLLWIEGADGAATQSAPALGRVIFAGEHLSDAFPGYMNGGAQTGRLAAQAILGRTIPLQSA